MKTSEHYFNNNNSLSSFYDEKCFSQNSYFMINNLFLKIGPCGKINTDRQITDENIIPRMRLDAR
jgi:hypothetical protein